MDDSTALRIMDALAEKIESLANRLDEAEKRLVERLPCEKCASCFGPGATFPQRDESVYLSESELEAVFLSMDVNHGTG